MARAKGLRVKPLTPLTRKARAVLVKRAKSHDLITFAALARAIGLKVPRNLQSMLNRIHEEDISSGRPSLAFVVVSAEPSRCRSNGPTATGADRTG